MKFKNHISLCKIVITPTFLCSSSTPLSFDESRSSLQCTVRKDRRNPSALQPSGLTAFPWKELVLLVHLNKESSLKCSEHNRELLGSMTDLLTTIAAAGRPANETCASRCLRTQALRSGSCLRSLWRSNSAYSHRERTMRGASGQRRMRRVCVSENSRSYTFDGTYLRYTCDASVLGPGGFVRRNLSTRNLEDDIEFLPLYHIPCVTLCTLLPSCQKHSRNDKRLDVSVPLTNKLTQVTSLSESHRSRCRVRNQIRDLSESGRSRELWRLACDSSRLRGIVTRDFWPFLAVCLTVLPFEFRPRTFTIGFYGKGLIKAYDFGVQFSGEGGCTSFIRQKKQSLPTSRGPREHCLFVYQCQYGSVSLYSKSSPGWNKR